MSATDPSVLEAIETGGLDQGHVHGDWAIDPVYLVDAERTVGRYAERLAAVHQVSLPPDVDSLELLGPRQIVEDARNAVLSSRVDQQTLSSPYRHLSVERLLQVLESGADEFESGSVALTHGRPVLAKLRCRSGDALGFVSWEHAAWADPHRDLAIAARDVASVLVPVLVPTFFERYCAARPEWSGPDPLRLDWYALAFELSG